MLLVKSFSCSSKFIMKEDNFAQLFRFPFFQSFGACDNFFLIITLKYYFKKLKNFFVHNFPFDARNTNEIKLNLWLREFRAGGNAIIRVRNSQNINSHLRSHNKPYEIFIYAKWGLNFCNLCTHIEGWQNANVQSPQNRALLTIPLPANVCKTEVRTINGFMLITIRNVNAWVNGNANEIWLT